MAKGRKQSKRWSRLALAALLGLTTFALLDWRWIQREHRHDQVILAAARQHGVNPALVKAVVWRESRFDARAMGRAGEVGLMQITEPVGMEWAGETGVTNLEHTMLFDPALNTRCGAWFLAKLLRRYRQADDPLPFALADYNAGRGNVLRWAKGPAATNSAAFTAAIGFPSTKDYVCEVTRRWPRYLSDFPDANQASGK